MLGGKNKQPLGYTIVEVLIVLAVSGLLFLVALTFINGKQERTAFTEGVNELASDMQNIIEQVADGKYSDIPLNCSFNNGVTSFSSGTSTQGQNDQCVFLGKMFQVAVAGNPSQYGILSIAGGRLDTSNNPIVYLTNNVLENPSNAPNADPSVIDALSVQHTTPQSLDITKMIFNDVPISYAIGFFQSQGVQQSNGALQTGSQTVNMYYYQSLNSNTPPNPLLSYGINNNLSSGAGGLVPAHKADICVTDNTQWAEIIIGGFAPGVSPTNGQLSVHVRRDGTAKPPQC